MSVHDEAKNIPLEFGPLLEAVELDPASSVKNMLATGAMNANLCFGRDGFSLLEAAALVGRLEVVSVLLEHGVDANAAGSNGKTALHSVVVHGLDLDLIYLLLSAGADIDARTAEGFTALHLAAKRPNSGDMTAFLLRLGATKEALLRNGRSSLHLAAEYGNLTATCALLAAGADATLRDHHYFRMTPLDVAAFGGKVEVIRELVRQRCLDLDAAPANTGWTALHLAASMNRVGSIDALVEAGASVDVETRVKGGDTPLHSAVSAFALEAMLALLRHGAPVLALPVRASQEDMRDIRRNESPLHVAARLGGTLDAAKLVDLLLRWGADESELDNDGKTAAEMVGTESPGPYSQAADADRVRELLANAPIDRAWRRRGLLLLCFARIKTRRRTMGRVTCGGEGEVKGKGAEEGEHANGDGGGGGGGGGVGVGGDGVGRNGSAVSSRTAAAVDAAVARVAAARIGTRERTLTMVGDNERPKFGEEGERAEKKDHKSGGGGVGGGGGGGVGVGGGGGGGGDGEGGGGDGGGSGSGRITRSQTAATADAAVAMRAMVAAPRVGTREGTRVVVRGNQREEFSGEGRVTKMGAKERKHANGSGGGGGGGGGCVDGGDGNGGGRDTGSTVPPQAAAAMDAAVAIVEMGMTLMLGTRERTPAMARGNQRAKFSDNRGGGEAGGRDWGEIPEDGSDFGSVMAMLLEYEAEGFFRTIVGYL